MSEYQLLPGGGVKRLSDNAGIPPDKNNRDYAEFLRLLAEGLIPDPVPVPDAAPAPSSDFVSAIEKLVDVAGLTPNEAEAVFGSPST